MVVSGILARTASTEMSSNGPALLNVWIYFNLIPNTILLPILVATFLLSKAKRSPVLINVLMTWILSGVFSLLLFYGGYHKGPQPPSSLCIAQASLLHGITPMWSVAVFILVLFLLKLLSGTRSTSRARMVFMLIAPYLVFAVFVWIALVLSLQQPDLVARSHKFFYCSLQSPKLSQAMTVFTFIMCVAILVVEGLLCRTVYKTWKGLRKARTGLGLELQLIARVLAFGIYVFFGMIVALVHLFDTKTVLPDMYVATIGLLVFLVFGTQSDVLNVWLFWRAPKPPAVELAPWDQTLDLLKSAAPGTRFDPQDTEETGPVPRVPRHTKLTLDIQPLPPATTSRYSPQQLVRAFTASNTAGLKFKMKKQQRLNARNVSASRHEEVWADTRMPFRLKPAPARADRTAQREVHKDGGQKF